MHKILYMLAVTAMFATGFTTSASADRQDYDLADKVYDGYRGRKAADEESGDRARPRVSLDQAVNLVRRAKKGKVIGASSQGSGSRVKHRVKVLEDSGRVRVYLVDGQTGRIY
ncbi:MAG: PepSY domain-containing protein [Woeseiaceae bacterium]|nr:PepSY domain-containing protein [Woeseiaceae bacterium]